MDIVGEADSLSFITLLSCIPSEPKRLNMKASNTQAGFAFNPNCILNLSRLAASLPVRSASSWLKISLICTTFAISQSSLPYHRRNKDGGNIQVSLAISFEVSGNFSIGFPLLRDTMGVKGSSPLVMLLFATRETLLVFLDHEHQLGRKWEVGGI